MNAHDDMSDTDVLSAVRDSLSGVPLDRPPDVKAVMASGRARQRRRLIPGVSGALAVAAGAALAVTALTPAGHPASRPASRQAGHQAAVRLAAWTVSKLADGDISITIRELIDPARLERTLRADGVPASVGSQPNPACRYYPAGQPYLPPMPGTPLLRQVFPEPYNDLRPPPPLPHGTHAHRLSPISVRLSLHGLPPGPPKVSPTQTVIVIDPSALPGNAGVQLDASPGGTAVALPQVVYASPQCTGS
jgi:hypothetical protein